MSVDIQGVRDRVLTLGDLGAVQMYHPRASAAVTNGLLNNLIAYWPGDEASGALLDAHTNSLDLTDYNTVTNNPGKVYSTTRQYTKANLEHHARPGDDALLSAGDVELTLATWAYMDSKPFTATSPASKFDTLSGRREYAIRWNSDLDCFEFAVRRMTDLATGIVRADALGVPSLSTWYLITGWHDPATDFIHIQVNNGAVDSLAHTWGILDGPTPFRIGAWRFATLAYCWDGRVGPTALWKSAAGGGGVLTTAQRTALWNSGAGLDYASFTT